LKITQADDKGQTKPYQKKYKKVVWPKQYVLQVKMCKNKYRHTVMTTSFHWSVISRPLKFWKTFLQLLLSEIENPERKKE